MEYKSYLEYGLIIYCLVLIGLCNLQYTKKGVSQIAIRIFTRYVVIHNWQITEGEKIPAKEI